MIMQWMGHDIKDLLLNPPASLEQSPETAGFIAEQLFKLFKFIFLASIPAFREIAYILALCFMLGGIAGINKSYRLAGESIMINLLLGLMQIGFKNM
jgi:hypothetical protein